MGLDKKDIAFVGINRSAQGVVLLLHTVFFEYVSGKKNETIYGLLGQQLLGDQLTAVKESLIKTARKNVLHQINEKIFIFSFLIASSVFFLAFFFMSIAIRDPIPILDELIISVVSSLLTYFLMRNYFRKRYKFDELYRDVLDRVSALQISISSSVESIESILAEYDQLSQFQLQVFRTRPDERFAKIPKSDMAFFAGILEQYLRSKEYRQDQTKKRKILKNIGANDGSDESLDILLFQLKRASSD